MDIHNIYRAIRPLKNRMHANVILFCLFTGLLIAGGISFLLACISFFLPIPFLLKIMGAVYAGTLLLALAASLLLRPKNPGVMREADSLGLKERLVTAYELKDDVSPISRIQRYDALKAVSGIDFRSQYPIRLPRLQAAGSIALAALVAVSLAVPSPARDKAQKLEALASEVKKQAEKIDSERKELSKKANIPEKDLKELNKKIDELLAELKKSGTEADALKALSKTQHELESLKNKGLSGDLAKLGEKLSQNAVTKDFGDALKSGNMADMKQRLEKINEQMKNLDGQGRKELADQLKQAAAEIANNRDLAQSLAALSQALAAGSLSSISDQMNSLSSTLSQMAQGDQGLADAMQQMENAMLDQLSGALGEARDSISQQGGSGSKTAQGNSP